MNIEIDGECFDVKSGETILETALRHGVEIPNLCRSERISLTASCRLCVVGIEGRNGLVTSCTTPCEDGMKVTAFSPEIEKIRETILDLQLSDHNDDCINCVQDGSCTLQDLSFKYGLGTNDRRFDPIWKEFDKGVDGSAPILDFDSTKCTKCGKCIKACHEIQGKGVLSFKNRGINSMVTTGYKHWVESTCDGCGECVSICPVGAITTKPIYGGRRFRNKDIEKTVVTTCPYCGVGCQLEVSTMKIRNVDTVIKVDGANRIPNSGATCVKGRYGLDFLDRPDRLTTPLIKKDGKFEEVSWDEALEYTAKKLLEIKESDGPDAIAGLSSARCTNEDNFLFQKFMRATIGTNNVDHCARLCHASTVAGLASTLGSGAMTNSIEELERAEVILVTGSNTTETHPVIANYIKRAVLFNKAKLIVVDPRKIDLVRYATVWLRQDNGTDVAWLNGMMNVIIAEGLQKQNYIDARTEGFDELKVTVAKYSPEYVEKITSIPAGDLTEAAKIFGKAKTASIVYSMGITQHTNGTDNVKSVANLSMITGNLGIESGGVNPLRGQNNVQGACDMGALPNMYPGYQKIDDKTLQDKFEKNWSKGLSGTKGLTLVEIMHAAFDKKVKAMYIMGENPLVSDPNVNHIEEALGRLDFLVVQDIFMSETAAYADVVFPATSFAEKDGTFTNTERRVLPVKKFLAGPGESREDWKIIMELSNKMGSSWNYNSWKEVMGEINILVPQYRGITPKRIENKETLQWPCTDENHLGTKFLHKGKFARGIGILSAIEHRPPNEETDSKYPYILNTGRILEHYHSGTMTRRSTVLNEYVPTAYVEMCKEDMVKLKVSDGEEVMVFSRRGKVKVGVKETSRVKVGSIFMPFHFAEASANRLTNDSLDPVAKIPELKVCAVAIEKIR